MYFSERVKQRRAMLVTPIEVNRHRLYAGKYRLFCKAKRYMWKRENSSIRWLRMLVSQKDLTVKKKILLLICGNCFEIKNSTPQSCGDELYVTRKNQVKVFDHQNGTVTYFVSDHELIKKADQFNRFYAPYFGSPVILRIDQDTQSITERLLIEKNQWRGTPDQIVRVIERLFDCLICYTAKGKEESKLVRIQSFVENVAGKCDTYLLKSLVCDMAENLTIIKDYIPFIFQHNDMVLSNIVKEEKGLTVFDYEFYGENIFYYDAMMWIMWEAVEYEHDDYLMNYLDGKYDVVFSKLFEIVKCTFDLNCRKEYAKLFLIANIHIHQITGDKTNLKKYSRILNLLNQW